MRRLLLTLALAIATPAARNDGWTIIGPGGGGAMYYPAVSPHDPRQALVACDMTGDYLTLDGGASWRNFNLGSTTKFFDWDPNDPKTIYAGAAGLYRSQDLGVTWKLVFPAADRVSGMRMDDDHASGPLIADGQAAPRITALAIEPGNSRVLYAAIGRTLQTSTDSGATWRAAKDFPSAIRKIWSNVGKLWVATDHSVWNLQENEWTEGAPAPGPLADIAGAPPEFYATMGAELVASDDGGQSWRKLAFPGEGARFLAVATSRKQPRTAYVSYTRLLLDGQGWFGVAKTTDSGANWQLVWKESNRPGDNMRDAWLTPVFGSGWGGPPLYLGVAPSDPDICYGTDTGRTMRTVDGGKTWDGVYGRRVGEGWASTGLDVTTNYGVHFDPFDPKRLFITYTDIGMFRSDDGGASWNSATRGVPRPWVNTTYWMVFDPAVKGRAWAVASGTHDLPRPKMWRGSGMPMQSGGVVRSDDGGLTWRKSSDGMPEAPATHIVLDARSPENARVLYVAAFGKGVYKSVDSGATWTLKNHGIAGDTPLAWRLTQTREGDLYVVIARKSEDGSIGNPADGALYVSKDGAESWSPVKLPSGVNGPNAVTVDPEDSRRLYLSAWQRRGAAGSGGVFVSTDAGATWRPVLAKDLHIYDVTVDPRNPKLLYACGFEASAWRSADRGETWERVAGYDFKWGHRVIPDPADPSRIYITTYGGSVWHGPGR